MVGLRRPKTTCFSAWDVHRQASTEKQTDEIDARGMYITKCIVYPAMACCAVLGSPEKKEDTLSISVTRCPGTIWPSTATKAGGAGLFHLWLTSPMVSASSTCFRPDPFFSLNQRHHFSNSLNRWLQDMGLRQIFINYKLRSVAWALMPSLLARHFFLPLSFLKISGPYALEGVDLQVLQHLHWHWSPHLDGCLMFLVPYLVLFGFIGCFPAVFLGVSWCPSCVPRMTSMLSSLRMNTWLQSTGVVDLHPWWLCFVLLYLTTRVAEICWNHLKSTESRATAQQCSAQHLQGTWLFVMTSCSLCSFTSMALGFANHDVNMRNRSAFGAAKTPVRRYIYEVDRTRPDEFGFARSQDVQGKRFATLSQRPQRLKVYDEANASRELADEDKAHRNILIYGRSNGRSNGHFHPFSSPFQRMFPGHANEGWAVQEKKALQPPEEEQVPPRLLWWKDVKTSRVV